MSEDKTKPPKVTKGLRWYCSQCPEQPSDQKPKGLKLMEHLNTVHQGHRNTIQVTFKCPLSNCKSEIMGCNDEFQKYMEAKHPKRHNSMPTWVFRIATRASQSVSKDSAPSSQNPGTRASQPPNLLPGTTQSRNREKDQHHEKDKSKSKDASQDPHTDIKDHSNRQGIGSNSQGGVAGKDHSHGEDHSKSGAKDKPSTQQPGHEGGGGLSRKESLTIDKKNVTGQLLGKSGGRVFRKDSVKGDKKH